LRGNYDGGVRRQQASDNPTIIIPTGLSLEDHPQLWRLNFKQYAETLMHELIHTLTNGADNQLSSDLRDLGIVPIGKNGKPLVFPTGKRNGKDFNDYSEYYDQAIRNACFPNLQ